MNPIIHDIYNFWFQHSHYWFGCPSSFDLCIQETYQNYVEEIQNHQVSSTFIKEFESHKKEIFVHILVCDQFSRHIFRQYPNKITLFDQKALYFFEKYQILSNIHHYELPEERCFLLMPLRHTFQLANIYTCLHLVNQWISDHYHKMYERFIKASCKKIYELNKEKIICISAAQTSQSIVFQFNSSILDPISCPTLSKLCPITKKNKLMQHFENQCKSFLFSIITSSQQNNNNHKYKVTVSISGGVDSCVCLYLLHHFYHHYPLIKNKIIIQAFMVNYGNRPQQSLEQEYVQALCQYLNIPFYVRQINELSRNSIKDRAFYETYTKNIRYDCYHNISDIIILGHNLDDCMENIINNIKKNINYENLKGMNILQEDNKLQIFRPLLNIKKDTILAFAHEHNIPFVYDSTSKECERGKIRDQMIPFLNQFDKNIYEGLIQLSNNYYEIYKIYEKVFPKIIYPSLDNYPTQSLSSPILIEQQSIYFFDYWKRVFSNICKTLRIPYIKNKSIHNFLRNIQRNKYIRIILSKHLYIQQKSKYFEIIL